MHVVNGFDLQEVRLLGHGTGFVYGFFGYSHCASFGEMRRFYDKECLIANRNEKTLKVSKTFRV